MFLAKEVIERLAEFLHSQDTAWSFEDCIKEAKRLCDHMGWTYD